MGTAYLGFYWTLPVNWAGFRQLPANVDEAAALSRTIRYQRDLVRRYVAEDKGTLVDEIAFIDVAADRATDLVVAEIRAKAAIHAGQATLLYVRFQENYRWRRNAHLVKAASNIGLTVLPLPPDPISIDGEMFNPAVHFKKWRERDETARTRNKMAALQGLCEALKEVPEGNGRWQAIAERLNGADIRTSNGGLWAAENVRKHVSRMDADTKAAIEGGQQIDELNES